MILYTKASVLSSPDGLYGIRDADGNVVVPNGTPVVDGVYDFVDGVPWQFYDIGLDGQLSQKYASTDLGVFPVYIDTNYANSYFSSKLHSELWFSSIPEDQIKSIITSTQAIDNLCFHGFQPYASQPLEFPRYYLRYACNTGFIPTDNLYKACAELSYSILNGVDIEQEIAGLRVTSRAYSSVRTTYDVNRPPEYMVAGIPSITAWNLLRPYVNTRNGILVRRVS